MERGSGVRDHSMPLLHLRREESGLEAESFTQNFPKKVFAKEDFGMTLKEAGLVPSAALIVR